MVTRLAAVPAIAALLVVVGCGSHAQYVDLPSNHGHTLDDALHRLHAVGLRASFPALNLPCDEGLPQISVQSPRAPARVKKGSVVSLVYMVQPRGSLAVPTHHPRWTYMPQLVGSEFATASKKLNGILPCTRLEGAAGSSGSRIVVVRQSRRAGRRLPAWGVQRGRRFDATTVELVVAARP